jgi:anti-sigma regulatory factor (Ser/Thr protein kinase)
MGTVSLPDTWVYALRLPHDPRAARVARMTVRAALDGHGRHELLDTVELLASELVTNAYRHTAGPCSLRLTALGDGRLRVGVWDADPYVPAPFAGPPGDRIAPAPLGDGGLPGRRGAGKLLWFETGSPGSRPDPGVSP